MVVVKPCKIVYCCARHHKCPCRALGWSRHAVGIRMMARGIGVSDAFGGPVSDCGRQHSGHLGSQRSAARGGSLVAALAT